MENNIPIGEGHCVECKKETVVNIDSNMCIECFVKLKRKAEEEAEEKAFQKIAKSCPMNLKGDCHAQVVTVYEYNMDTGQQDIIYESCKNYTCPVWHFVKSLQVSLKV